jgi:hypothetical protein
MGVAGYVKPNNAQTVNIKNIPAKRNSVYLDSFIKGENVSIAKLEISTRKRGKKKSNVNGISGAGGYVRHITMRSNGSSNIIGAAIVPTMALPKATQNPLPLSPIVGTPGLSHGEETRAARRQSGFAWSAQTTLLWLPFVGKVRLDKVRKQFVREQHRLNPCTSFNHSP